MPVTDDPRHDHHRGPCRGDGVQRRSVAWLRMREEAETRPCPVEVPPARKGDEPLRCGAAVGQTCRYPGTDTELHGLPAHHPRLTHHPHPATEETTPR